MNYGYVPTGLPSLPIAAHESEQFALQLYSYVATLGSHSDTFAGLDVLEVGSGRGGGAAFLARNLQPQTFIALDFSSSATALARSWYQHNATLEYVQGDAENLFFDAACFHLVLNVESAHCYGSLPRFVSEVQRVLRPGGELLFADFVSKRNRAQERLQAALTGGALQLVRLEDITPNVVRALALDEDRKQALLDRWVSGPFKTFARGAYAMQGTAMRRELASGQTVYLAAVLRKDG
jgi:ubiquinone/menaquinone biosynthesis C-methylase UbiE